MSDYFIFAPFIVVIFIGIYFIDAESESLEVFCWIFGHRDYMFISKINLERGDRWCRRCGRHTNDLKEQVG